MKPKRHVVKAATGSEILKALRISKKEQRETKALIAGQLYGYGSPTATHMGGRVPIAENRRAQASWTSKRPTKPGWYWLRRVYGPGPDEHISQIVEVKYDFRELVIVDTGYRAPLAWWAKAQGSLAWHGPIEEPA